MSSLFEYQATDEETFFEDNQTNLDPRMRLMFCSPKDQMKAACNYMNFEKLVKNNPFENGTTRLNSRPISKPFVKAVISHPREARLPSVDVDKGFIEVLNAALGNENEIMSNDQKEYTGEEEIVNGVQEDRNYTEESQGGSLEESLNFEELPEIKKENVNTQSQASSRTFPNGILKLGGKSKFSKEFIEIPHKRMATENSIKHIQQHQRLACSEDK